MEQKRKLSNKNTERKEQSITNDESTSNMIAESANPNFYQGSDNEENEKIPPRKHDFTFGMKFNIK